MKIEIVPRNLRVKFRVGKKIQCDYEELIFLNIWKLFSVIITCTDNKLLLFDIIIYNWCIYNQFFLNISSKFNAKNIKIIAHLFFYVDRR